MALKASYRGALLESTLRELESLGYAVVGAKTGAEAIDMLQSGQSIALVFNDIDMPGGMTI